ncbi:luciferin sulfotransferase-like [Rhodnius prolixus]|uniref:Putative sulfotransferase n=1 Tax=Rhodnius prolixus TaxID=13249 RepID=R4FLL8_RHOPR
MFPYEITKIEGKEGEELLELFTGEKAGFVQVGPKKWTLPTKYAVHAENIYSFEVKEDDLWIVTFPRSGTTLMQELVWLVGNKLDYETSFNISLNERVPFFEFNCVMSDAYLKEIAELNDNAPEIVKEIKDWDTPGYIIAQSMTSPRYFKTHLPPSLLPPNLVDTCKMVYVARNPLDVAVSFYHHNRLIKAHGFQGDFRKYWELFEKDLILYSPYWEHIKEGWEKRNHPNVLFLFYEDILRDFTGNIRKIGQFLNKQMLDDEIQRLADHLHIDNFRKTFMLENDLQIKGMINPQAPGFIRRGKIGGNQEFDDAEIKLRAEKWFKKNLANTDIIFPKF